LDFHGISRFSDVSIINNLNALIQKVNIGFLLTDYTKKNDSRIRKKTFYLQFCMGTPEGHQKSIFNTPKVKKKQRYIFASSTQKHKNSCRNTKSTNRNKKISNKSIFSTSKVKRRRKFVWGLPDGVCRLNPKS
jgi:hypothetical protein